MPESVFGHFGTAIDNVRHTVCLLLGIRRGTNRQGMGDLQYLPKDIVLIIAKHVWAARRDPIWLEVEWNQAEKKKKRRKKKV